jgi:hypothetical protein
VKHSDLIFALAGEQTRKEYAVKLLSEGLAPRLLLSVARFDVRRFSQLALPFQLDLPGMAAKLSPAERHFFVFVEDGCASVRTIPNAKLGTLREIVALRAWLNEHRKIASLLVISSGFHLMRVRMCCRSLLPKCLRITFLGSSSGVKWWKDPHLCRNVSAEFWKVPFYALVLPFVKLNLGAMTK